ncbi:MAG: NADH-quinone oxidoreductase subunit M [Hyphomonadaceae bacterium]
MGGIPILSLITFLPAIGALVILMISAATGSQSSDETASGGRNTLLAGTFVSLMTFALALAAFFLEFDAGNGGYQMVEDVAWFGGIHYKMGVDGISMPLVLLTAFLTPLCLLASKSGIKTRITEYVVAFLLLEALVIGVFCALDLFLFYIFFEAGLIPMFIIIGVWGGANRIYAAFKFFLYTLFGSLFMLVAMVYMYVQAGSSDFVVLEQFEFAKDAQVWLWLAFFASFAVKMPMWPVHTWLPDAHVQAPTAGSVILAGILLKLGAYGLLRFSVPMFPDASVLFQPFVFVLSVIAIVYASLVAFRQEDMKKMIAYSSVAHMGFVTLGIFSFNQVGMQGAVFQMLSHGFISSALFLIVGVVYDRVHTREIAEYGGLAGKMPVYAAFFMLFTMGNVGLPGTSGFVGEIMSMTGGFMAERWVAVGAALGVIFSAIYMLRLYRETMFGEVTNPKLDDIKDVNATEVITLLPLAIATIVFGVAPWLIFNVTDGAVSRVLTLFAGA